MHYAALLSAVHAVLYVRYKETPAQPLSILDTGLYAL